MNLENLGWDENFTRKFEEYKNSGYIPARVILEHKQIYRVSSVQGELMAEVSGKFYHQAASRADFPTVGDWVAVSIPPGEDKAIIHALVPRRSSFSRKAVLAGGPKYGPGKTEQQVLAANIDNAFLVSGLDGNFNLRRLERYLTVAWDSGANPVVILNKADLCENVEASVEVAESVAFGVPILAISASTKEGIDQLYEYIEGGKTIVFLGSSGVGKSTIINSLIGQNILKTGEVREDDRRGRHTTTHRELIVLPKGGIVIDTPGLRELALWGDEDSLRRTFDDIEELASQCRFNDCRHDNEPGCAVREAIENGSLDADRFANYLKMQKELKHLAIRQNQKEKRKVERAFDKKIRQYFKDRKKLEDKGLI